MNPSNKDESSEQYMSRLDRDKDYRIAALHLAILRAGQDGGLKGEIVDVYDLAEGNYAWLKGEGDIKKPAKERLKKTEGLQ